MTNEELLIALDEAESEYKNLAERSAAVAKEQPRLKKEIEQRIRQEMKVLGEDLEALKALKLQVTLRRNSLRKQVIDAGLTPLSEQKAVTITEMSEFPAAGSINKIDEIEKDLIQRAGETSDTMAGGSGDEQKPDALQAEFDALGVETILKDALPPAQIGLLIEAKVMTGADLHLAYENRETDRITGIGEKTWQKITDAVHAWHESHANQAEGKSDEVTSDPPALGNSNDVQTSR